MSRICNVFDRSSMRRNQSFVVMPVMVVPIVEVVAVPRSMIAKKTIAAMGMIAEIMTVMKVMATDVTSGIVLMNAVTVVALDNLDNPKVLRKIKKEERTCFSPFLFFKRMSSRRKRLRVE